MKKRRNGQAWEEDLPEAEEAAEDFGQEVTEEAWPHVFAENDGAEPDTGESWDGEELPGEETEPEEEKKTYAHSIFKPNTGKPAFVLTVAVNVVRMLMLIVVLAGLAGVGAVAGIAKGYMETAPTLDLAALDDQAQTSFICDADWNLITEYKGSENRVMVSIEAMPMNRPPYTKVFSFTWPTLMPALRATGSLLPTACMW